MIKNFKQFNEGINHLLVGPTKEEVWSDLMNGELKGFINHVPVSPEDFFNQMKDGCVQMSRNKYGIHYGKNGEIFFQVNLESGDLYVRYRKFWSIFEKIYGLNDTEIESLIKRQLVDDTIWNGLTPSAGAFKNE